MKPLAEDLQSKIEAYSKDLLDKELTKKMIAFITLMASVGLMSFQFPEESFDTLAELLQVYEEMDLITCNKGSKIAKKRKLNDGNEKIVGKNQKAMQVFMDILVSLLAKSPSKFIF